jgi:hypothetical protein
VKFNFKAFTWGVLAAIVPSVGAAWAFATLAAEHVLAPHLEGSRARIQVMCAVAEVQNAKLRAICETTGAACDTKLDQLLIASCREATK